MYYLEIALFIAGLVVLVVGYRRNQRNLLFIAAILLFLVGVLGGFVEGFEDGFNQAQSP